MPQKVDWDSQLGRRLKLRDLHVFFTVAARGSMAKAAAQLGVTAPSVSEVVAGLEYALGVKLFDRTHQGVEPTLYGNVLLKRGLVAFDELRQGIRDIEFLADPTVGQLRLACDESVAAATLPLIIQNFSKQYPGIVMDVEPFELRSYADKLRDRTYDLVLTRRPQPDLQNDPLGELNIEILFNDALAVAVGAQSPLALRRKIKLAELSDLPWILTAPGTWNHDVVAAIFRSHGLTMPRVIVNTLSVYLRTNLLSTGGFVTAFPRSVLQLHAERFKLKELRLGLPARPWPVSLLTLKHRTLSPVVERFMSCARETAKAAHS
ncbi:MAG: LysR family transcriptional regulator [Xanthobacteraceae bacterium]